MAAQQHLELPLRIVIHDPVPGVALAMQRGKSGAHALIAPASTSPEATTFDFTVNATPASKGQAPRLLGPYVQGPPDGRFVYVCIGAYAGDAASPWARRAKIPLTGLTWPLIEALRPGQRLAAHVAGRDHKGAPACASIPLLPQGWGAV